MKHFIIILLFLTISTLGQPVDEYRLKAVFIERFSRFISWSEEDTLPDTIRLGIAGSSIAVHDLTNYYSDKKIQNRSVDILSITDLSQISDINILFVVDGSSWTAQELCDYSEKSILIIGDEAEMIEEGAVISFKLKKKKLRFVISLKNAEKRKLSISSYLLEIAEVIPD